MNANKDLIAEIDKQFSASKLPNDHIIMHMRSMLQHQDETIAELRKDAARIDWTEKYGGREYMYIYSQDVGGWQIGNVKTGKTYGDKGGRLRDAIDAAMEAEADDG